VLSRRIHPLYLGQITVWELVEIWKKTGGLDDLPISIFIKWLAKNDVITLE